MYCVYTFVHSLTVQGGLTSEIVVLLGLNLSVTYGTVALKVGLYSRY